MTYQKPIPNYDNADADQASLLVLTAVDASLSLSLGQGGGVPARKKKNGVPTMRARIVLICFLLGIFAVIYGGRGSSHTSSSGILDAFLLGHNQAAPLYDPNRDHCFTDEQHHSKFCWFPINRYPCGGGWKVSKGQVCVAFLCTRVKSPNEQDYEKLGRVITYLMNTIHLPLIIGADDSGSMVWNIDASFAVHADCKSHTGASLTLGHGSVLSMSCKQKINTKSSTEAELVGVDDAMTFVMWMKHFFESQVKQINEHSKLKRLGSDTVIEQDNTSAIQLEKNGWKSSSKRTKHIDVRYFYVTDRLKKKDISRIVYKPTGDMESDYFTKALQGTPFHTHRKTLMGLDGKNDRMFYDKFKHPKINDDKLYTPQPSSE